MKKQKKFLKTIALSMVLAAGLLSPATLPAQEQHARQGGLFGHPGGTFGDAAFNGLMDRSGDMIGGNLTGQGFGSSGAELTGQTFGEEEELPLGSGLFVLLAASAGYATLKTKKKQQEQNRKENKA